MKGKKPHEKKKSMKEKTSHYLFFPLYSVLFFSRLNPNTEMGFCNLPQQNSFREKFWKDHYEN